MINFNKEKIEYLIKLLDKAELLKKNITWRLSLFEKNNRLYSLAKQILAEYTEVKYGTIDNIYSSKAAIVGLNFSVENSIAPTTTAFTKLQDRLTILEDKTFTNIVANDYNNYITSLIVFIENILYIMFNSKSERIVLQAKILYNQYIVHPMYKKEVQEMINEYNLTRREYYNLLEDGIRIIAECIFGLFFSANEDLEKIIFVNL